MCPCSAPEPEPLLREVHTCPRSEDNHEKIKMLKADNSQKGSCLDCFTAFSHERYSVAFDQSISPSITRPG